jgi:hypothetical protein
MSVVTRIILVTHGEDGAQRDGEYPNVDRLNAYLRLGEYGTLQRVEDYAGGTKVMDCNVWLGGFNFLNLISFLSAFDAIPWEYPEDILLLVKREGEVTFTQYRPIVNAARRPSGE